MSGWDLWEGGILTETRVLERCASFIRQVLAESSKLPEQLVEEGYSLIGSLDDILTRRFDDPQPSGPADSPARVSTRYSSSNEARVFVQFVLGEEACAVLRAVGEGGYGRLSDIRRFADKDSSLLTNEGLQRLFSLGLLYGVPYFFLTSRGVAAYTLLTGKKPVPSKKEGRLFSPVPVEELIEALRERFKQSPTLSGGELLVLRTIYAERLYKISLLEKSQVAKAFFRTRKELEQACQDLRRRSLVSLTGKDGILLSSLGRVVAEAMFEKEVDAHSFRERKASKQNWVDRLIEHFEGEGFRVYRRGEHPKVWGANGTLLEFDLLLVRDRRKKGILFPPFEDEASRKQFRETLDLLMQSEHNLFVVGPGKKSVERAKVEVFDWLARIRRNRVFTMRFGTMYDVFNGKLEEIVVEPNQR